MANDFIIVGDPAAPILPFGVDKTRSIQYTRAVDIIGDELSIDTITADVDNTYAEGDVEIMAVADYDSVESSDDYLMVSNASYGELRALPYGTPVYYLLDTAIQVKAYLKNVDQIGTYTYRINGISAIGILDNQMHYGNIYTGQSFEDVVDEIIDDAVPYTIDADVKSIPIYGWLPFGTKRSNLHELLFACGVSVGRNEDGDMHFRFLTNADPVTIPQSRIYINGSVDYSAPASEVQITEHSYMALAGDDVVVEYDNTDGAETASNTLIQFRNAPLHDLTVTGTLTISEYGVNYAIISGTGTLSGKTYTHSTRVLTKVSPTASSQLQNIVKVEACTLINVLNSQNVATRALNYYSSKKTVSSGIVIQDEAPGMLLSAADAFLYPITGYLSTVKATVSAITKGDCTIITDYTPSGGGNNYSESHLYTGTGTIDLAALLAGVSKDNDFMQAILLAGGHGGYPGEDGARGTDGDQGGSAKYGTPGEGGQGGAPGEGGNVYVVTFRLSDLSNTTLAYSCGSGGASNTAGGATTLGAWSSDAGAPMAAGIADIFSGTVYGTPGELAGQPGGSGSGKDSVGSDVEYGGQVWHPGANGAGATGGDYYATGGRGGGAAVGSDGGDGEDAEGYSTWASAGYGGDGADGAAGTDATLYGCGGNGGHGGGGAGVGGVQQEVGPWYVAKRNGYGGHGGDGGQGGPGLVMILV